MELHPREYPTCGIGCINEYLRRLKGVSWTSYFPPFQLVSLIYSWGFFVSLNREDVLDKPFDLVHLIGKGEEFGFPSDNGTKILCVHMLVRYTFVNDTQSMTSTTILISVHVLSVLGTGVSQVGHYHKPINRTSTTDEKNRRDIKRL